MAFDIERYAEKFAFDDDFTEFNINDTVVRKTKNGIEVISSGKPRLYGPDHSLLEAARSAIIGECNVYAFQFQNQILSDFEILVIVRFLSFVINKTGRYVG